MKYIQFGYKSMKIFDLSEFQLQDMVLSTPQQTSFNQENSNSMVLFKPPISTRRNIQSYPDYESATLVSLTPIFYLVSILHPHASTAIQKK